jgi:hypothetical protein
MVAIERRASASGVEYLSREQAQGQFDEAARAIAGVSGEDFIRRWDAGEYRELRLTNPVQYGRLSNLSGISGFGRT